MDIRNYEYDELGSPIVGATVTVYTATLVHPPVTIITSGVTNGDGMWSFTGLAETAKDVKVEANGQVKWYKGKTSVGVSTVFFETPARFLQVGTPAAPGANASLLYSKVDGRFYKRSGASGAEVLVADFESATGVLTSTGWGTVQTAHIGTGQVTSTNILDGTILNADVNAAAAIAYSKLNLASSVATADLVASATSQISQVNGSTGSPTTTLTTFADVPEMSITLTTTGGPIMVTFEGGVYTNNAAASGTFGFSLDAAAEVHSRGYNLGNTLVLPVSITHVFTGVAAGSHTFKTRWKVSSTHTLTAFSTERSMIAVEYKR